MLYVAGNHEFYGHGWPGLIDDLRHAADGSPLHVLENDETVLAGVRFLGCTLWTRTPGGIRTSRWRAPTPRA